MDCTGFQNEITRREAGLLDAAQLKALETHLAGCAACTAADRTVKAGMQALAAIPVTPAPRDFLEDSWRRIQKAAPAEPSPLERIRRWFADLGQPIWVPLGAAAAVLVLLVALPGKRGTQVASGPKYRIIEKVGEVKETTAPNGAATLATLGSGHLVIEHLGRARYKLEKDSRLEIGYGRAAAIELSRGSATVEVSKDPSGYTVELSGARVEVLGTRFMLDAGASPMCKVLEGRVRVSGPDWRRELGALEEVSWGDEGPVDPKARTSPPPAAAVTPPAAASPSAAPVPVVATAPSPVAAPVAVKPASAKPASPVAVAASPAPSPSVEAPAGATAAPVETGAGSTVNDPFEK